MIDTNEIMLGNTLYYDNGAIVKIMDVTSISEIMVNQMIRGYFRPIELDSTWLKTLKIPYWKRAYYKSKYKYVHRLQNYLQLQKLTS